MRFCRFVNDVLHNRKRSEDLLGRAPAKRTHREIVVFPLPKSKLYLEVLERIELVRGIEIFVVLAVAALNLAVVARGEDPDKLVLDAEIVKGLLKERGPHGFRAVHPVCELGAIVRLDAFNRIREFLYAMADKLCGRIRTVFFEGLQIPKAAVFVDESELKEAAIECCVANKAGGRNELHVDLYPLAWILHLLVRPGNVFRIWQLYGHLSTLLEKPIQAGDRSLVAALAELYPEHDQARMRVSAPHVVDELDLIRPVPVWMAVRTMRTIFQRLQRTVVAFHPAVDVLPVCPVPNCCFRDAIFLCVVN